MNKPIILEAQIRDVVFGKNVKIVKPVNIYECFIGDDTFIGPFVEIQKGELVKNNKIHIDSEKNYAIFNNEQRWETMSKSILDELSIYLALSEDVQKNPNQDVFTYQVVDENGINQVNFKFEDYETITINNIEIESMKMVSSELELTLNLSKAYNFLPVIINRVNKKNHYRLALREFKELR